MADATTAMQIRDQCPLNSLDLDDEVPELHLHVETRGCGNAWIHETRLYGTQRFANLLGGPLQFPYHRSTVHPHTFSFVRGRGLSVRAEGISVAIRFRGRDVGCVREGRSSHRERRKKETEFWRMQPPKAIFIVARLCISALVIQFTLFQKSTSYHSGIEPSSFFTDETSSSERPLPPMN